MRATRLDHGDGRLERDRVNAPDRIRTCDLRFRRPTLYPTELQALGLPGRRASQGRDGEFKACGDGGAAGGGL